MSDAWLMPLLQIQDAANIWTAGNVAACEQLARKSDALVIVGTNSTLFVDNYTLESTVYLSRADSLAQAPLPTLPSRRGSKKAAKLLRRLRELEIARYDCLSRLISIESQRAEYELNNEGPPSEGLAGGQTKLKNVLKLINDEYIVVEMDFKKLVEKYGLESNPGANSPYQSPTNRQMPPRVSNPQHPSVKILT